jgi:hypothetical protein
LLELAFRVSTHVPLAVWQSDQFARAAFRLAVVFFGFAPRDVPDLIYLVELRVNPAISPVFKHLNRSKSRATDSMT